MQTIDIRDFQRIELRIGTIIRSENFEKAKKPAYKLWIDLGPIGVKKSSAQITARYLPKNLIGRQVLCVCNLAPKQIADFISEVLVTGFEDEGDEIIFGLSR